MMCYNCKAGSEGAYDLYKCLKCEKKGKKLITCGKESCHVPHAKQHRMKLMTTTYEKIYKI